MVSAQQINVTRYNRHIRGSILLVIGRKIKFPAVAFPIVFNFFLVFSIAA